MSLWQRARASETRLEEIREGVPEITEPDLPKLPENAQGVLDVRDLSWTPEGAPRPVLDGVSFRLDAGRRLGIVGRIGSGKSSLLHLIARLENPPAGTIFIDGVDVRDYPLGTLRKTITLAPQDGFLFSDSLRSNIVYGAPDAPPDRITAAVDDAGLSEPSRPSRTGSTRCSANAASPFREDSVNGPRLPARSSPSRNCSSSTMVFRPSTPTRKPGF
jgi:ATP-binding cassette subfamily B protein